LMWARMSGVVIWCEHECPGWSFDVSTNVRGGHLLWARMSGVVIWWEHECPALSKIAWERMSVGTNVRTPVLVPRCWACHVTTKWRQSIYRFWNRLLQWHVLYIHITRTLHKHQNHTAKFGFHFMEHNLQNP